MRTLLKIFFVLTLIAIVTVVGGYTRLLSFAETPVSLAEPKVFELTPGTSLPGLSRSLAQEGVVTSAPMFQAWVRLNHDYQKFQAGKYRFESGVTPSEVATTLARGAIYTPVVLSVTIPEGWPLKSVIERLAANGVGTKTELKRLASDQEFLKSQNVPGTTIEGFLYPATYTFHTLPTPAFALTQMVKTFWQNLPKDYEKRVGERGLTLAQAVTFASLIETETRLDDEKSLISEVIWARLKDRVPLAIDAALIYGIPDYAGDLKWAHLSDAKNPYNTRIHQGLPPTAIGAPGAKSLEAVLTPTNLGVYYYVLSPGGSRHHFSKTLKEHNEHVKKLLNGSKR